MKQALILIFSLTLATGASASNPDIPMPLSQEAATSQADDDFGWTVVDAEGVFIDGFVCAMYLQKSTDPVTVTVEKSETRPGWIRIVNAFPFVASAVDLIIDASNPDCVKVPYQYLFKDEEDGITYVVSWAENFPTEEEFFNSKYASYNITASTTDNVTTITFPYKSVAFNWPESPSPKTLYTPTYPATGMLRFTVGGASVGEIEVDEATNTAEFYDTMGRRLTSAPANGIYIERKGNNSTLKIAR